MNLAELRTLISADEINHLIPILIAAHYASGGDTVNSLDEFLVLPEAASLMPVVIQHLRDGRRFWIPMLIGNHLRDHRGVVFLPTHTGGQQVVSICAERQIRRKWHKRKKSPTNRHSS